MSQGTEHFSRKELECKCGCGRMEITAAFLEKIEELRTAYNKPMTLTSGYRCPQHNNAVSDSGLFGPHTQGAVDIAVSGVEAHRLLQVAFMVGFTGIGVKQNGPFRGRFIHLDDLPANTHPRPRVWSY